MGADTLQNCSQEHRREQRNGTLKRVNFRDITSIWFPTIGDTVVNNNGITHLWWSNHKTGINAGNLNITNVKAGVNDTDAVNVKQLKDARTVVTSNDNSATVNKTENGNQVTLRLGTWLLVLHNPYGM